MSEWFKSFLAQIGLRGDGAPHQSLVKERITAVYLAHGQQAFPIILDPRPLNVRNSHLTYAKAASAFPNDLLTKPTTLHNSPMCLPAVNSCVKPLALSSPLEDRTKETGWEDRMQTGDPRRKPEAWPGLLCNVNMGHTHPCLNHFAHSQGCKGRTWP